MRVNDRQFLGVLDRSWLKGSEGDALNAVLCAVGFNIRWLLRAIVRLGLAGLFFVLAALSLLRSRLAVPTARPRAMQTRRLRPRRLTVSLA